MCEPFLSRFCERGEHSPRVLTVMAAVPELVTSYLSISLEVVASTLGTRVSALFSFISLMSSPYVGMSCSPTVSRLCSSSLHFNHTVIY